MPLDTFFKNLWNDYTRLAPQAKAIHQLFRQTYQCPVINDHVAFRTFGRSPLSIDRLEPLLASIGYLPCDEYHFEQKKLFARSYVHPSPTSPLIFLSELNWWQLSPPSQAIISEIIARIPENAASNISVFWEGLQWPVIHWNNYQQLETDSEYAAWLSAHGLHANHFTVSVNALPAGTQIAHVTELLRINGYPLNQAGGEIKGSESDQLMQASTLAPDIPVQFANAVTQNIPGCYYEFAQRFTTPNGELFKGFVPASADKIFESTDRSKAQ